MLACSQRPIAEQLAASFAESDMEQDAFLASYDDATNEEEDDGR